MIEIKITVATPDILVAAQIIAEALKGSAPAAPVPDSIPAPYLVTDVQPAPVPQPAPAPAPEKPKAAKKTTKKAAEKALAPAPAPQTARAYTLDDLTRAGAELVDKGFMNQVLAVMDGFNVPSLLDLPKDCFEACAAKFRELDPSVI